MKAATHPRKKPAGFDARSQTFTLSKAKTYLGRLVHKAQSGETIYIVSGRNRFILQAMPEIDPIPVRPPGYFASSYSDPEIKEQNQLAKASVIKAPKDLE